MLNAKFLRPMKVNIFVSIRKYGKMLAGSPYKQVG